MNVQRKDAQRAQHVMEEFVQFMEQANSMFNFSELQRETNQWYYSRLTKFN